MRNNPSPTEGNAQLAPAIANGRMAALVRCAEGADGEGFWYATLEFLVGVDSKCARQLPRRIVQALRRLRNPEIARVEVGGTILRTLELFADSEAREQLVCLHDATFQAVGISRMGAQAVLGFRVPVAGPADEQRPEWAQPGWRARLWLRIEPDEPRFQPKRVAAMLIVLAILGVIVLVAFRVVIPIAARLGPDPFSGLIEGVVFVGVLWALWTFVDRLLSGRSRGSS
jgi:hypothetical protein